MPKKKLKFQVHNTAGSDKFLVFDLPKGKCSLKCVSWFVQQNYAFHFIIMEGSHSSVSIPDLVWGKRIDIIHNNRNTPDYDQYAYIEHCGAELVDLPLMDEKLTLMLDYRGYGYGNAKLIAVVEVEDNE